MAMELNTDSFTCYRCGATYPKLKGNFHASYHILYRGVGFLPYCKDCVLTMFEYYLTQCGNIKNAVRQMCRKLDLPWSEKIFESVEPKSTPKTIMSNYIAVINQRKRGKSYDDTLIEEDSLWSFCKQPESGVHEEEPQDTDGEEEIVTALPLGDFKVTPAMIKFWGAGFTPAVYKELTEKYAYWVKRLKEEYNLENIELGMETIIKQICNLEIEINRDRAAGKSTDKNVNTLNTLLTSANLKPVQKSDDTASSFDQAPAGVWTRRFEFKRPIPEPTDKYKDVDGLVREVDTWYYGHTGRMFNVKGMRSELYDEAIKKLRVERPEFDDLDDESLIAAVFGKEEDDDNS